MKKPSPVLFLVIVLLIACQHPGHAHPWKAGHHHHDHDHPTITAQSTSGAINPTRTVSRVSALTTAAAVVANAASAPASAKPFLFFPNLQLKWDKDYLSVGSNGLPAHPMMIGITAWQQQVPLPQNYTGENAWRIPLNPIPAATPAMIDNRFLRGAIALAVNGIPIFNPQNNRGEISYEIGELDQWGGHCGRADDYHYHVAPLHLQTTVGKGMPIAYALDGYPIYGLTEPDGSAVHNLDTCNGHHLPGIGYHYHASNKYPYVIGGFHGQVNEVDGQVDPQPRAQPTRPASGPLRGAKITHFEAINPTSYQLTYTLGTDKHSIRYTIKPDNTYEFTYDNGDAGSSTETYTRRAPGRERPPRRDDETSTPATPSPNPTAGSPGNDPNRKPWIYAHAAELDANHDRTITLQELTDEATRTFSGYDADQDGKLSKDEQTAPGPRSPMAGFIKQHPDKIDTNRDGILTQAELLALATRLFKNLDRDADNILTAVEIQTPPPAPPSR